MVDWWMTNLRCWWYWSGVCHQHEDDIPARKSWWGRLSPPRNR